MKRIRFKERAEFEQFGRKHPDNPVFEDGSEHTLRNDQADRWLRREVAELVEDFGPDEIPGADPEQVAEIQRELEKRAAAEVSDLIDDVIDARAALVAALDQG